MAIALGAGMVLAFGGIASAASSVWKIQNTPNPKDVTSGGSPLSGVACPSTSVCEAVGSYSSTEEGSGIEYTLAEAWNGTAWTVQKTPNPKGAYASYLNAVACSSTKDCTAVGSYIPAEGEGIEYTLAERWNGTAWTIQKTPNPKDAMASELTAVACPSTSACEAVGRYYGRPDTLAEAWNGTAWTIQKSPNPKDASESYPTAVACPSTSACTAVGYYFNSSDVEVTLAEAWNGTAWTVQKTPNPSDSSNQLYAVACPSTSACTAVGTYLNNSQVTVTLAERWNGTAWTIQKTPNLNGANVSLQTSRLSGVACPSTSACIAVGDTLYYNSSTDSDFTVTLAEAWNGTAWTIQKTPNPKETPPGYYSVLSAVACPLTIACTAVGDWDTNSSYVSFTLAEAWNGTT